MFDLFKSSFDDLVDAHLRHADALLSKVNTAYGLHTGKLTLNGKTYTLPKVEIRDNEVYVDGKKLEPDTESNLISIDGKQYELPAGKTAVIKNNTITIQ